MISPLLIASVKSIVPLPELGATKVAVTVTPWYALRLAGIGVTPDVYVTESLEPVNVYVGGGDEVGDGLPLGLELDDGDVDGLDDGDVDGLALDDGDVDGLALDDGDVDGLVLGLGLVEAAS
jgi:hypothetical protein